MHKPQPCTTLAQGILATHGRCSHRLTTSTKGKEEVPTEKMAVDIDFTRRNKKARLLTDSERDKLDEFIDSIHYSSRYPAQGCPRRDPKKLTVP